MRNYLSEPCSWSGSCLFREPLWSRIGEMKFLPCCCCCCWFKRWGVLSTTGTTGNCTAVFLMPGVDPFPEDKGIARIWPAATWPRGPGALATLPSDCSIWGVAAKTVPCKNLNDQHPKWLLQLAALLTFDRSTALTAPDAIDTGTPFPAVAWTTLIICGWPGL